MPAPAVERDAPLVVEPMPLVGAGDASEMAACVVQHLLDDEMSTPIRAKPVAVLRLQSCSRHGFMSAEGGRRDGA